MEFIKLPVSINMIFSDYLSFSEWYHYVLLFVWLIFLLLGLKYYTYIENLFKPKTEFDNGKKYGVNLLLASFIIGFIIFLLMTFSPAKIDNEANGMSEYLRFGFFGLFVILILFNGIITIRNYQPKSIVTRIIVTSFLMFIYLFSGVLGGLLMSAIITLIVIIYALIKLKKILTLR